MRVFLMAFHLLQNMGLRYVLFRAGYELKRRSGFLKLAFPVKVLQRRWATLADWKQLPTVFLFESREQLQAENPLKPEIAESLKTEITEYKKGNLLFFNSQYYAVTDWFTNPKTDHRYSPTQHWTEINDFSPTAGDIKYVWEKSRFSFLYPLIRYDLQTGEDLAETVFQEIDSWIAANHLHCGPNWRCSQEIALRVLNWTYALHYYKNSPALTEARFERIVHLIYWQTRYVAKNINFSLIAVRNNHAITETLTMYLVGLFYPFFAESATWKKDGKRLFEQEIAYQIYEDGTFLQFSMNYHRVVVQLLTLGTDLAHRNNERFADVVYDRYQKSLEFLQACQDPKTGWLPNYGNNDGAIFFKLDDSHYRDYRSQCSPPPPDGGVINSPIGGWGAGLGGYYTLRDDSSFTFLRCGAYKDRPFQADNLHLDLWVNGENIMRDAGSYQYNTDERWIRYFAGTASHNTVMLGDFDQMQKGPQFLWYHWVKEAAGEWKMENGKWKMENLTYADERSILESQKINNHWTFEGKIRAFGQVGKNIYHHRKVIKTENELNWLIEDRVENAPAHLPIHQIWHPSPAFFEQFTIRAYAEDGQEIAFQETEGWYSSLYGQKEPARRLVFTPPTPYIRTEISHIQR